MTQRGGGDEPVKDAAALQELAAGVVHGVYRTVKACQFHADVSNDAVTGLTAAASNAVAEYCARAATETVALSFLGDAIFVNRQILKASRDTHALAAELRDMLEVCEVTELTLAKNVDRATISVFAKLLADVQRDRSFVPRVKANDLPGITAGRARFAATGASREESPGQRAARTYATSVLTVQNVLAEVRGGKYELPRKIKRVAQQVVARADEDARLLVALAATGGVSLDAATIAVGSAILAVAMTRQLTTDRAVLANAAMTALLYDAGKVVLGGAGGVGPQRILNDDELDRVPARSVVALTALSRMHAPARARTALLYEVWSMRRAHRLGPVYKGRRPPTLLARIIGVARAFAELRAAGADGGLSIDDALQVLGNRATEGTERALVKLLIGALGIYPAGTMVSLSTGELGVVMGTPTMPLDYVRPPVKILYDQNANLLDTPIDVDLAVNEPDQPARFITKSVDADEQQTKAMRAYVVAATAAKRRAALDPSAEPPPSSTRGRAPPLPVPPQPAPRPRAPTNADFEAAQRATAPPRAVPEATLQSALGVDEHLAAARHAARHPPVIEAMPPSSARRPPAAPVPGPAQDAALRAPLAHEATPRSAQVVAAAREPSPQPPAVRRRDPRNDSAPPSSMQDEIHRPVRVSMPRPARPQPAAAAPPEPTPPPAAMREQPRNDAETARPPPSNEESPVSQTESTRQMSWEAYEKALTPNSSRASDASPDSKETAPPPPSNEVPELEEIGPASEQDRLLAAFLADAPIDAKTDPPPAPKDAREGKVTVKRER